MNTRPATALFLTQATITNSLYPGGEAFIYHDSHSANRLPTAFAVIRYCFPPTLNPSSASSRTWTWRRVCST